MSKKVALLRVLYDVMLAIMAGGAGALYASNGNIAWVAITKGNWEPFWVLSLVNLLELLPLVAIFLGLYLVKEAVERDEKEKKTMTQRKRRQRPSR